MLEGKDIKPHKFRRMKGDEITVEWIEHDPDAFREPILIEQPEGLGMKMPEANFSPQDVADMLGGDYPVEVIGERGSYLLSSWFTYKYRRCRNTVQCTWLDAWQVGGVFREGASCTRPNPERHLSRNHWD